MAECFPGWMGRVKFHVLCVFCACVCVCTAVIHACVLWLRPSVGLSRSKYICCCAAGTLPGVRCSCRLCGEMRTRGSGGLFCCSCWLTLALLWRIGRLWTHHGAGVWKHTKGGPHWMVSRPFTAVNLRLLLILKLGFGTGSSCISQKVWNSNSTILFPKKMQILWSRKPKIPNIYCKKTQYIRSSSCSCSSCCSYNNNDSTIMNNLNVKIYKIK